MTDKENQIKSILGHRNLEEWAKEQLKLGQKMEDMTYFDFIKVSFDEVMNFAMKNGFGWIVFGLVWMRLDLLLSVQNKRAAETSRATAKRMPFLCVHSWLISLWKKTCAKIADVH